MERSLAMALALEVVRNYIATMIFFLLVACIDPVPPQKQDSHAQEDSAADSRGPDDSAPPESEPQTECSRNEDCNDNVECTENTCDEAGNCVYTPDNSQCSTISTCMDAFCDATGGCEEVFADQGSTCDLGTCSVDTCDGAGVCVAGAEEDPLGTDCDSVVPCSGLGKCGMYEGIKRCECICADGELMYEINDIIVSSRIHYTRGNPIRFVYEDGSDSGWISCPSELQAVYDRLQGVAEDVTIYLRYPCSPDDDFGAWFNEYLNLGCTMETQRLGRAIAFDAVGNEQLHVQIFGCPISIDPWDPTNLTSYTFCEEYAELVVEGRVYR